MIERERPLRLLYLLTSLDLGGAEQQVRLLAREFRGRGSPVDVVTMVAPERPEPLLAAAGAHLFSLGMPRGLPDPRGLVRLARLIRQRRPDLIHAQMVHANLLAAASRLLRPGPAIVTSARSVHEGSAWRYAGYRLTRSLVEVSTAVSGAVADELARRGIRRRDEIVVVPNGVVAAEYRRPATVRDDCRKELDLGDRFAWLAAGRLVPAKAYPLMIEAFAAAHRAEPASALLIAGDGPLEAELRAQVATAGLGEAIRLLGRRDDVPELLSAADGYLLSSEWEGLPMVLLEAASAGLPAVATDVAGTAEVIRDGQTGLLVPPGDPSALTQAMLDVMRMPASERAAMGHAARARVGHEFDLPAIADRWQAIYRDAIARRAARISG